MKNRLIFDEFNYTAQRFRTVLDDPEHQSPLIDRSKIKNIEDSIEDIRINLLEEEIKEKYPDAEIDYELLKLVGTAPNIPLKKEKEEISEAITLKKQAKKNKIENFRT